LGDLINSGFNNPFGSYNLLDLVKEHIGSGGNAVIYDKLSGKITHYISLDENNNFKFIKYR
jgi:hypothetical protein